MPDTLIHREVVYGNHAVATFNERVLSIESTRLLAEYDWRRWKYRVEDYAFLNGWERADNMTELYVLREKIRHLFKWLRLWHADVLERFVGLWWTEYWDGGQRFVPFPSSWINKDLDDDSYDSDALVEDDDLSGGSDREIV